MLFRSIAELARMTMDILGRKKPVVQLPNPLVRAAGRTAQALKAPFPVNPNVIPYATLFWLMDNQRARTELGATFRGARETLTPTLAWLRDTRRIAG